jgi:formylglycine-generating enzyme required for sulfatase activity
MKKTLQRQGVLLALALGVAVCAMACRLRASEAPIPGDVNTVDLGGGVKMELVWVPAGSFQMGWPDSEKVHLEDEVPAHTVELDGFWMGKYEVAQEQYEAVMGKNPSFFKGAKNPVDQVSWNDAWEFCRKASRKTGKGLRLPTEAEWEYACRAGTRTPFSFGETISRDQANCGVYYKYRTGKKGEYRQEPVPVGSFQPNAWGLYDMHGNVREWCGDRYGYKYYGKSARKNPRGPLIGAHRVVRSSSWYDWPCRSASRGRSHPTEHIIGLGFRVVCGGFSSR